MKPEVDETLIIIIVVVVVVDDETYYWVYLSSNHLFQVYYKVRQVLLQSATAFFITKCDGLLLESAAAFLLQSATSVITKCDRYYKVRRLLQSATVQATPSEICRILHILQKPNSIIVLLFLQNNSMFKNS